MDKRSKPRGAVTTNIAKGKHKLSPIEKELLECCKNHQPVLLYGDDEIGRNNLLQNVHKSTELTVKRVNLAGFGSSKIYNLLAYQFQGDPREATPSDYLDEIIFPYGEGCFYCCTGLLFLDNLICNDEYYPIYHKLAAHIHEGCTSYKWLVAYTDNPDCLPPYFKEQFKLVSIDGKNATKRGGKLRRGEKKCFVDKNKLIRYMKQQLEYLKSDRGGGLSGGQLVKKMQKDIDLRYKEVLVCKDKDNLYAESTVSKMISEINTGKI